MFEIFKVISFVLMPVVKIMFSNFVIAYHEKGLCFTACNKLYILGLYINK